MIIGMKGIAHFAVGVAAASLFPEAVRQAAAGNPLYFILGGVCGLLPDTLDFKFYRFFYRHDIEVRPDPKAPDVRQIADAIALAVNRAGDERKPIRIKLDTIRLGTDAWRQYQVRFDVEGRRVVVALGPVVDTGQTPLPGQSTQPGPSAGAPVRHPLRISYEAAVKVDILDGPLFQMQPGADGAISPDFIPWHREWTHSFTLAALIAAGAWLIWNGFAAAVVFAAFAGHIAADQMGFMGSNLFYPFTRARTSGLKFMHSGQSLPNFATVWLCVVLIFWNLSRNTPGAPPGITVGRMLIAGLLAPAALYLLARWLIPAPATVVSPLEDEESEANI